MMDLGIAGRTALVMGGSKGIGHGIATELAAAGCRISIVARTPGPLAEAVDSLQSTGADVIGVAADLTDSEAIPTTVAEVTARLGAPQIVIFNPPTPQAATFLQANDAAYAKGFEDLVFSFSRLVRSVLPAMREARWGRIVTIGSATVRQPMREEEGGFGYAVANTGRLAAASMSKVIATEVAKWGVTVNTIATGSIATKTAHAFYAARAAESGLTAKEFEVHHLAKIPMGREGAVEEIASLAAYLCSQRAGYITGETILCDGGRSNTPI